MAAGQTQPTGSPRGTDGTAINSSLLRRHSYQLTPLLQLHSGRLRVACVLLVWCSTLCVVCAMTRVPCKLLGCAKSQSRKRSLMVYE